MSAAIFAWFAIEGLGPFEDDFLFWQKNKTNSDMESAGERVPFLLPNFYYTCLLQYSEKIASSKLG